MLGVLILASGNSSRMNGENKILARLGGTPVVVRAAGAFAGCDFVSEIVVAAKPELHDEITREAEKFGIKKPLKLISGGAARFLSMKNALAALDKGCEYAAVHDGARPMITPEDIRRVFEDAEKFGAAIACKKAVETVKIASPDGFIEQTPDRSALFCAQTPQIFRRGLLEKCIEKIEKMGIEPAKITDDAQILELCGERVRLTEISGYNLKITRREDLEVARALEGGNHEDRVRV